MNLFFLLKNELLAIAHNKALLLTVFGGVLFYSFLYPLPYISQVPREQDVIVVDLDESGLSRTLTRMVDATPQVHIVDHASTIEDAQKRILQNNYAGMLVIPQHFYRDLAHGKNTQLAFAGDASYFLVFSTVLEGMVTSGQTLAAKVKVMRMLQNGESLPFAKNAYSTIKLKLHPMFNEAEGYVNYVIAAVFILILHQTLLMGLGILFGTENHKLNQSGFPKQQAYWIATPALQLLLARVIFFIGIYTILSLYYLGPCLVIYDLPRLAPLGDLLFFGFLFLLTTSLLGIALGTVLQRKEHCILIVLLSSLPLVFSCGFIWPKSAIPTGIDYLMQLVPAVPAIQGFVKLNQMGANVQQISPQILQLTMQAGFYFLIALLFLGKRRMKFLQGTKISGLYIQS